jgi:pimeloyl-ACP methyl ester carboxylesterase
MTTFVLVPGAGGDTWFWHRLVAELERRGHTAIPVELPAGDESAGLAAYADTVLTAIGDRRPVVLVAQSMGGLTAPLVCDRADVELLVLLNGMVPRPGETGADWWTVTGQAQAQAEHLRGLGLDGADDDAVVYFHDVPADVTAEAMEQELHQTMRPFEEPWPLTAWPDVPTRVLTGRDDRLFPAEFQRRIAVERLRLEPDVIPGGHLVALSRPVELADLLEDYVRSMAPSGQ